MSDKDYFGLNLDRSDQSSNLPNIHLAEKQDQKHMKHCYLKDFITEEDLPSFKTNAANHLKKLIDDAIRQSRDLPTQTINIANLRFEAPMKWVITFIGEPGGLVNLDL